MWLRRAKRSGMRSSERDRGNIVEMRAEEVSKDSSSAGRMEKPWENKDKTACFRTKSED
jgi:hypothetical protein